jgi:hypothetical protein
MKNRSSQTTGLLLDAAATRFRRGLAERIQREAAEAPAPPDARPVPVAMPRASVSREP